MIDRCKRCGAYESPFDDYCTDCVSIDDKDEWRSNYSHRCPKCKHITIVDEECKDEPASYPQEDENNRDCEKCGYEYTFNAYFTHTLTSPPLLEGNDNE